MGCFQDALKEFEAAHTQVLGVSIDPWPSQGAFAKELKVNFPLLSDWPTYQTIKAYDAWNPQRNTASRISYVIDKQGIIQGVIHDEQNMEVHGQEALRIVKAIEGIS